MTTALNRYLRMAARAKCPPDQIRNFRLGDYCAQEKQLPFHAAARLADAPDGPTQIGQGGARGGAKSHAAVCQVALDDCVRYPGLKWLYLRSIGASARESFRDLLAKALPGLMQYYIPSRSTLDLPNGSRVLLGGFRNDRDIEKYIGLEYDGIVKDDAHLISAEKHALIDGSLRTSKQGWRPRSYATFNPGGIGHAYLKRLFVDPWRVGTQTGTRFFFSLPEDNAFLNPEYVAYLETLKGWLYRAWRKGDFDIAAGQFFTTWRRGAHVIEPFRAPLDWTWWAAMDYGFVHPTVVYLFAKDGDGTTYVVDEHYQSGWLVKRHAEAIKAMFARNDVHYERLETFVAGGDVFYEHGSSETTVGQQYEQHGLALKAANRDRINGAAQLLELLGDVDNGQSPRIKIFNRCAQLIECIPAMQHNPRRPEDVLKVDADEEGLGGDDPYDCARYGLMELDNLMTHLTRIY